MIFEISNKIKNEVHRISRPTLIITLILSCLVLAESDKIIAENEGNRSSFLSGRESQAKVGRLMYFIGAPFAYASLFETALAFQAEEETIIIAGAIITGSGIVITQTGLALNAGSRIKTARYFKDDSTFSEASKNLRRRFLNGELCGVAAAVLMTIGCPVAIASEKPVIIPFIVGSLGFLVLRDYHLLHVTNQSVRIIRKAGNASNSPMSLSLSPLIIPGRGGGLVLSIFW